MIVIQLHVTSAQGKTKLELDTGLYSEMRQLRNNWQLYSRMTGRAQRRTLKKTRPRIDRPPPLSRVPADTPRFPPTGLQR